MITRRFRRLFLAAARPRPTTQPVPTESARGVSYGVAVKAGEMLEQLDFLGRDLRHRAVMRL
jgi:hypothetical protein